MKLPRSVTAAAVVDDLRVLAQQLLAWIKERLRDDHVSFIASATKARPACSPQESPARKHRS